MAEKFNELEALIQMMISGAKSGHYASSMSALQIMYPLFYEQGIKPLQFILSKGHAAPALYAILCDLGYLTLQDLKKFRKYDGLPGHPSIKTSGVLCSSGSLGMGISKALGLAHVNPSIHYHVLVGDGELQEGQNWEAFQYIAAQQVKNITIHVDANGMQYSGEVNPLITQDMKSPCLVIHHTTWEHDNKYLTKPKRDKRVAQYGIQLLDLMETNKDIYVLNADLEHDFALTAIKESYPDRYIQCGISEQHMVSMAGGLAREGKLPVCHTFACFYRRTVDQIYNCCCDDFKILYVAGLSGELTINIGKSHEYTKFENYLAGVHDNIKRVNDIDEFMKLPDNCSGYMELS